MGGNRTAPKGRGGGSTAQLNHTRQDPTERVLDALCSVGHNPKEKGSKWEAQCPSHQDTHASLHVATGGDGRALINCKAGCSTDSIVRALGLDLRDLFVATPSARERVWVIRDADGNPVAEHVRKDLPGGDKKMWFRRKGADNLGGLPMRSLPLYGSHLLKDWEDGSVVVLCEGEKAADAVRAAGLQAVGTVCGASVAPDREVLEPLRRFDVVLWPDADTEKQRYAGQKHMQAISGVLADLGCTPRWVDWPDAPPKGDAADTKPEHVRALVEQAGPMPVADIVSTTAQEELRFKSVDASRMTEGAAGERFADEHHADLRYVRAWRRWLWWTGTHWKTDGTGEAERRAKATVLGIYQQAGREVDDSLRQRMVGWARKLDTHRAHAAMLALASSDPRIAVTAEELDCEGWLLNCLNGTIDLRDGKLRPHRREDLITRAAPVEYHADAVSEEWDRHITHFMPDADVRRQLQRDLGVSLVGGTLAEVLSIWHGFGANAKTTTWSVLLHILGEYAIEAPPGLLLQRKHDGHPTELARLRGSRLVVSSEVSPGAALNEQRVKDLTGGGMQSARYTYGDFFDFERTWSIVLACNHKPRIRGSDSGIWRRVRIIPWTVSAEGWAGRRPQDEVVERLVNAGPAILRWLVAGLHDWLEDPGWIAEKVTAATAQYREEQDRLAGWLAECCEVGPHHAESFSRCWDSYTAWCEDNREKALGRNVFRDRLTELGFEAATGAKRTAMREGLRLLTPEEREARDAVEPLDTEAPNPQSYNGEESSRMNRVNRPPVTFSDPGHGELPGGHFTHFTHEENSETGTESTCTQAETLWVNRVCGHEGGGVLVCADCGRAVEWLSETGFCDRCGGGHA